MARATALAQAFGTIGLQGRTVLTIVPGASILVCNQGTSTPISETIYAAATGSTTLTNPLTTDATGTKQFYLEDPKTVTLIKTASGYTFANEDVVAVESPSADFTLEVGPTYYNGESYGFVRNTDNAAAWATVSALMAVTPGLLYLPGGTWPYSTATGLVLPKKYCGIIGDSWATILQPTSAVAAHAISNHVSTNGTTDPNAVALVLRDFYLDCANQPAGAYDGINFQTNPSLAQNSQDPFDGSIRHLVFNVMVDHAQRDAFGSTGQGEQAWIRNHAYYATRYSFNPTFDSAIELCTSSQAGDHGFHILTSPVRLIGCKSYYSGRVTTANGMGFYVQSGGSGGTELTGCEAQDNRKHGFQVTNSVSVSLVSCVADSNSGTYNNYIAGGVGIDVFATTDSYFQVDCQDRNDGGFGNRQRYAAQVRSASKRNEFVLTHKAVSGSDLLDPFLTWDSDCTPNSVRMSSGLVAPAFAASFTPTPVWGANSGDVVEMTLTGNITVNAPATGQRFPGQRLVFVLKQDGTGGRTITWNAVFVNTPTSVTTANAYTIARFVFDGTSYVGM